MTQIHCVAAVDPATREEFDFGPDRIPEALELLSKADRVIAHYGLGYDYPALERVHGFILPPEKRWDSYVVSKTLHPGQKDKDTELVKKGILPSKLHGKHSIEAWGYRLGRPKLHTDIEDWSKWTPEMHERCIGDTWTNTVLWDFLKPDEYPQAPLILEHEIAILVRMMEDAGVPFDEKAAQQLHVSLLGKQSKIADKLMEEFKWWFEPIKKKLDAEGLAESWTPKKADPKRGYWGEETIETIETPDPFGDGPPTVTTKKVFKGYPLTKLEKVAFNPSSRRHIVKKLKGLGWEPKEFTPSGEAQLDDDILKDISDRFPQASSIVEYLLLDKRLGQIADGDNAWLKKVGPDGRIHGAMDTMGTVHSRASHFSPNMGQVPASKSPYGKDCRALFGPNGKGRLDTQVGADMSGLQLRGLGHYLQPLDGGAYIQIVTTGDVHWSHAQAMGLVGADEPRDKENGLHEILREKGAKTFGYAYIFGCFEKKSGEVVRDATMTAKLKNPAWGHVYEKFFGKDGRVSDKKVGQRVRASFDERLSLGPLQDKLKRALRYEHMWKGHLPGLDGRWVPCRSDHSALNFALSSAEAILCKKWIVESYKALKAAGYEWGWDKDFVFMLWVHDEIQVATRKEIAEHVGEILVKTAKEVGIMLGFRTPLDSEYKVGLNWAETH